MRTDGLELRALVPVALRAARRAPATSSATASRAMRATLPVGIADPLGRLEAVRSAMSAP